MTDVKLDLLNTFWTQCERNKAMRGYVKDLRVARPFCLDADMDQLTFDLAYKKPAPHSLMRAYLDSARLPFRTMWLEHPAANFDNRAPGDPIEQTLLRVGWLLRQPRPDHPAFTVQRIAQHFDMDGAPGECHPAALVHFIDPSLSLVEDGVDPTMFAEGEVSAEHDMEPDAEKYMHAAPIQMCGWGFGLIPPEWDEALASGDFEDRALRSPLRSSTRVMVERDMYRANTLLPAGTSSAVKSKAQATFIARAAIKQFNELPYLITALALINEVPVIHGPPVRPRGHIRSGGTLRPYIATTVISIDIPYTRRRLKDVRGRLREASDIRRAAHECRGHWRHVQKLPKTNPERWQPSIDMFGRPCFKTWIEPHMRGSGEIGFNQHLYVVSANPDATV